MGYYGITGYQLDEVGQPVQPLYGWIGDNQAAGTTTPTQNNVGGIIQTPIPLNKATGGGESEEGEESGGYSASAYDAGSPWSSYAQKGLDYSSGLLNYSAAPYPKYYPSQKKAPESLQYPSYVGNESLKGLMQGVTTPDYRGLMSGDYEALQQALTTPGYNAATGAYNTGTQNLANVMSGRGLYGSSIMQNQQREALDKVYQEALANNAAKAAAARYGLQATDLANQNQFNAQMYQQNSLNALNQYQAGVTDAERLGTYNVNKLNWDQTAMDNLRNWQNAMEYEQNFTYPLNKGAYQNAINEQAFNRGLSLAGAATPLYGTATQYALGLQQLNEQSSQFGQSLAQNASQFERTLAAQLQQQAIDNAYRNTVLGLQSNAANQATNTANTAAWLGLLGTGLGAAGNAYSNWSQYAGNDSVWDFLGSLFSTSGT